MLLGVNVISGLGSVSEGGFVDLVNRHPENIKEIFVHRDFLLIRVAGLGSEVTDRMIPCVYTNDSEHPLVLWKDCGQNNKRRGKCKQK